MKQLITIGLVFSYVFSFGQIPAGYYDSAEGLTGYQLQNELKNIIDGHFEKSYDQLWNFFGTTDKDGNNNIIDIYSNIPGGTPSYTFTFNTERCGNAQSNGNEGDCYNREHSVPHSWFNSSAPMYTDLFHVYPTDSEVNNKRGNYSYGETNNASWTSSNGSKLGPCSYTGCSGTIFEPIDEYKGDLARTYFYMITRYKGQVQNWDSDMLDGDGLSTWSYNMLVDWHTNDPVSTKEQSRNDAIYGIQNNRNPFIDHPEWVAEIGNSFTAIEVQENVSKLKVVKTTKTVQITSNQTQFDVNVINQLGQIVYSFSNKTSFIFSNESLEGLYFFQIKTEKEVRVEKVFF